MSDDGVDSTPQGWRARAVALRRSRPGRVLATVARVLLMILVPALGAWAGIGLYARTQATIGPFETTMRVRPMASGGSELELAPLGQMHFTSHRGPLGLRVELDELREDDARAIAADPESLVVDEDELAHEVRTAVEDLGRRTVVVGVLGAAATSVLYRRTVKAAGIGALVGLVLTGGSVGLAARSWDETSLAEPRYTGLLRLAPQAVGDARDVVDRFEDYQAQLAGIVENVAILYQAAEGIRTYQPDDDTIAVLHVSDLHLNPQAFDLMERIVPQFGVAAVLDTGDINDWGTPFEAGYADRIRGLEVPYVFVRGNHDSATTARSVAAQPNAVVLEGERRDVAGLTIWGAGDPRFTPDKSRAGSGEDEEEIAEAEAPRVAREVRRAGVDEIDVVMVHDQRIAADLGDSVPLVLAGHTHQPSMRELSERTVLLVEGSTGGAGLRGLQDEDPVPLTASVLYFDADSGRLEALDRIEVAGGTQSDVRIQRIVIDPPSDASRSPGSGSTSTTEGGD